MNNTPTPTRSDFAIGDIVHSNLSWAVGHDLIVTRRNAHSLTVTYRQGYVATLPYGDILV